MLYFGGPNTHNLESLNWFIEEVYRPLLKDGINIELLIGGSICKKITNLDGKDNISLLGRFDDLFDFYSKGDLAVNPTFGGSGLKIKSFEAMAYGKVLISHEHSTEGIYDKHNAPIFTAHNAEEFKRQIIHAINNKKEIEKLKDKSILYIQNLNNEVERVFATAINHN